MLPGLVIALLGPFLLLEPCHTLRLATFNIQVLGKRKIEDDAVVSSLITILSRYDVVFVQEIRDCKGTAFSRLVDGLSRETHSEFGYNVSRRLGRSSSQEQYGVLYKLGLIEVIASYQDPDPTDKFQRPPYSLLIRMLGTKVEHTVVTNVHIEPKNAFSEMDALYDSVLKVKEMFKQPLLLLGDMNADCSYLSDKKKSELRLKADPDFRWLVPDDEDTTLGEKDCAYDRIIVSGWDRDWYNESSIRPYKFDQELDMDIEQAKKVSDHYPVEMEVH
ncbi:unnamed protein product [Dicrocoelium dendriticum]|nr:unnamed protein product [Dicrocoelium dendriticum]